MHVAMMKRQCDKWIVGVTSGMSVSQVDLGQFEEIYSMEKVYSALYKLDLAIMIVFLLIFFFSS